MSDVKSARRVLDILRFFSQEKAPASLARIASALDFPKSSCLALLETLTAEGYAYQSEGRYYLTRRWLCEAELVARHDPIALRCRPALEQLAKAVGETAILAQLAQREVIYLDVVEPDLIVRFSASAGQMKPIHASASGKALLSALPPDERKRLVDTLDFKTFTQATMTTPGALLKAVEEGRRRGWHVNRGEHQADTVSVAVPAVLDGAVLALVVGAPMSRVKDKVDRIGAAIERAASGLTSFQSR
jgi:DNA-binding IclR family transcriptional regulator